MDERRPAGHTLHRLRSSSARRARTRRSSRRSAIGRRDPTAASSGRPTAAGTGRRCCFSTKSAAARRSSAAPDAPGSSIATLYPAVGTRGASPALPVVAPAAPPTPPRTGHSPPARGRIFKSADGGATWATLRAEGLPSPPVGRQAFGIVAQSPAAAASSPGFAKGSFDPTMAARRGARATEDPRIRPVGVITDPGQSGCRLRDADAHVPVDRRRPHVRRVSPARRAATIFSCSGSIRATHGGCSPASTRERS